MKKAQKIKEATARYLDKIRANHPHMPYKEISNIQHHYSEGYADALSDMKEGVDVEKLRLLFNQFIDSKSFYSDPNDGAIVIVDSIKDAFEIFLPYIHQPAQESDAWISVKDRLPEMGQGVLVFIETGQITVSYRTKSTGEPGYSKLWSWQLFGDKDISLGLSSFEQITHWMPLPQVPSTQTQK